MVNNNWGEPEQASHENGPMRGIMVCIYVAIIYPAFVAPWFLRSVYALKCSIHSGILMWPTCAKRKHRLAGVLIVCCDEEGRQGQVVNAQTHG